MDESPGAPVAIEADGLSVLEQRGVQIASLRYFAPAGRFAGEVRDIVGRPLPQPLQATCGDAGTGGAQTILLWRAPTETLLLSRDPAAFAQLEQRSTSAADGCMVDQTGGFCVLQVTGTRAADLLVRLGSTTSIPELGEARSGRLAEVNVLTACVQRGEVLMLVERVHANHLRDWIAITARDF